MKNRRSTVTALCLAGALAAPAPAEAGWALLPTALKAAARTAVETVDRASARLGTTAARVPTAPAATMPAVRERLAARAARACAGRTACGLSASGLLMKIPSTVRACGPAAIGRYLDAHDLSHIRSKAGSPRLSGDPDNVVFEPRGWNRARGSRDMTLGERVRLRNHNRAIKAC